MKQTRSRSNLSSKTIRPGALSYSYYHSDRHADHTIGPVTPAVPLQQSGTSWSVKRLALAAVVLIILIAVGYLKLQHHSNSADGPSAANSAARVGTTLNDPASINVVVNKQRPLQPIKYAPGDLVTPDVPLRPNAPADEMKLRSVAAQALQTMFTAATLDGIQLLLESGYRSYNSQVSLYNYYTRVQGQATADEQSARPGYSEHQTGLAVDIAGIDEQCAAQACFGNLPEAQWLASHAYLYGFIVRYPSGKQAVTGYEYEPWHLRYVGVKTSTDMHNKNISTLEEYYNLPAAPDYH